MKEKNSEKTVPKLKIKRIKTLYPVTINYCIMTQQKQSDDVVRYMKKHKGPELTEEDFTYYNGRVISGGPIMLIIIHAYNLDTRLDVLTTIRHETHHAAAKVFEYIEQETDALDDETLLYLADKLFSTIVDDFNKNYKLNG